MNLKNNLIGTTLLTATAASVCCITPVLALIAGSSGLAAAFSWLVPLRPYFIALTLVVLVFAWYQQIKPLVKTDCNCDTIPNTHFMPTRTFLSLVTALALIMLTFPNYANVFYTRPEKEAKASLVQDKAKTQTAEFKISGMTCDACTLQVANEVNKVAGILNVKVSYAQANAVVEFDISKTTAKAVEKAIKSTGYKVTETKIKK